MIQLDKVTMKQRKSPNDDKKHLKMLQERMEKTLIQNLLYTEDTEDVIDPDEELMVRQKKMIQLQKLEHNPISLQNLRIRSNYLQLDR